MADNIENPKETVTDELPEKKEASVLMPSQKTVSENISEVDQVESKILIYPDGIRLPEKNRQLSVHSPTIPQKKEPPKPPPPEKDFKDTLSPDDLDLYNRAVSGEIIPVLFIHNSNDLSPTSYKNLSIISEIMKSLPESSVEVMGHTDNVGTDHYNKKLSEFRANIVKSYIIGKGIETSRVTAYGMGSDYPIASNENPSGRRINRRVEIKLVVNKKKG